MKCVKDRLFKRIWTVLLALMITVSFTPAVIFSESGADGAGQPAQTEQAGVKDGGGSTEKETAVEVASKDGDTDSEKGKKDDKAELSEKKEDNKEEAKKEENTETEKTGTTGETVAPETEVFEVTFECADPAGNAAAVTVGAFTIEKGGKIPSVPDAKDYAGYEFRGWQKKEDGSAGPVSGAEIVSAEVTDNVTYAAVYRKKAENTDNNDNTNNGNDINGTSKGTADQASGTAGSSDASGNGSAALKNGPQETGTLVEQDAAQIPQLAVPDPAADLTAMTSKTAGTPGEQQPAEEGTAKYTVVYYLQSEMDPKDAPDSEKTYYFQKEKPLEGKVGENTAPPAKNHYVINNGKTEQKKIASDGSTVVNVYYDREIQTINFYKDKNKTSKLFSYSGLYGSTLEQNGYTWPDKDESTAYEWYDCESDSEMTFLDAFLLNEKEVDYYRKVAADSTYRTITHWKEAVDGSWIIGKETSVRGSGVFKFRLSNKFIGFTVASYKADDEDPVDISDPNSDTSQAKFRKSLQVYHKRNDDYVLSFMNCTDVNDQDHVKYQASLAAFKPDIVRPEGIDRDAEFAGWYTDESYSDSAEIDWSGTMPAHNLRLYAKWNYRWTVKCVDEAGTELIQPIENTECVRSDTPVMAEAPEIAGYKAESESQEVNKNNQMITFKYKRKPDIVSSALLTAPRSYNGRPQAIQTVTDLQTDRGEVLEYAYYRIVNGNRIKADSLKDAGTYEIEVSILRYGKKIWRKTFKNIVVSVRSVTLTSVSRDMLYDGSLLEGSETDVKIGGDGFVDGEGVVLKMTGSQRASGSCRNSFTYTARKGTNLANYEINTRYGTLTVNPRTGEDRIDVSIPFDMSHFSVDTDTGKLEGLDGYEFDFNGNTFKLSGLSAEIGDEIDRTKHIYELKFVGKPVVHDINKIDVTAQFKFNLKGQFIRLNEAFGGNPDDIRHGAPSGLAETQAFEHVSGSGFNPYPDYGITEAAGGGTGTGIVIRTVVNGERIGTGARVNHRGTDLISRMFDDGNASWYKKNMDRIQRDLRSKRAEIGKKAKKEKKGLPLLWWLFHKEPFGGVIGNKYQVKLFGIIPISDTAADVTCVLGVMIAALAAMLYILKKAEKLWAEMTVELEDGGKIPAADSQVLRW